MDEYGSIADCIDHNSGANGEICPTAWIQIAYSNDLIAETFEKLLNEMDEELGQGFLQKEYLVTLESVDTFAPLDTADRLYEFIYEFSQFINEKFLKLLTQE